jgi:hypothetical protein
MRAYDDTVDFRLTYAVPLFADSRSARDRSISKSSCTACGRSGQASNKSFTTSPRDSSSSVVLRHRDLVPSAWGHREESSRADDVDNRIKTLFDGLKMPREAQDLGPWRRQKAKTL